jgi:putative nucleotidyltransferase with HDIG domain
MIIEQAEKVATEIMGLYKDYGGAEYAGEKVSQLEHMVQAAQLAEEQGYDEEVILAAFFHDIGHICAAAQEEALAGSGPSTGTNHLAGSGPTADSDPSRMGGYGVRNHEEIGAAYLREKGFSKKIARLVESHVEAKRYLTAKDPVYYGQLSEARKMTLEYQGGPLSEEEAAAFEQYPLFDLIIRMRKWDEEAKIEQKALPELGHYREMMLHHLASK